MSEGTSGVAGSGAGLDPLVVVLVLLELASLLVRALVVLPDAYAGCTGGPGV